MARTTAPKAKRKYTRRTTRASGASEPMEQPIGQDTYPRGLSSTGPAREALDPQYIQVVERPVDQAKLDELQFMEDMVTIMVHDDPDPNADPMPMVGNGGDRSIIYLKRGEEQVVKRKYVEVLARAKITKYGQKKVVDENGYDKFVHPSRTTLRIPFSVIEDPAGAKGRGWLMGILQEA